MKLLKFRHDSCINFKTYFIKKACLVQHSNDGIIVVPLGNADIPFLKEEVTVCQLQPSSSFGVAT